MPGQAAGLAAVARQLAVGSEDAPASLPEATRHTARPRGPRISVCVCGARTDALREVSHGKRFGVAVRNLALITQRRRQGRNSADPDLELRDSSGDPRWRSESRVDRIPGRGSPDLGDVSAESPLDAACAYVRRLPAGLGEGESAYRDLSEPVNSSVAPRREVCSDPLGYRHRMQARLCPRSCCACRAAARSRDAARSCGDRTRSRTRLASPGKARWFPPGCDPARERLPIVMLTGVVLPAAERRPPSAFASRPVAQRIATDAVPGSVHWAPAR